MQKILNSESLKKHRLRYIVAGILIIILLLFLSVRQYRAYCNKKASNEITQLMKKKGVDLYFFKIANIDTANKRIDLQTTDVGRREFRVELAQYVETRVSVFDRFFDQESDQSNELKVSDEVGAFGYMINSSKLFGKDWKINAYLGDTETKDKIYEYTDSDFNYRIEGSDKVQNEIKQGQEDHDKQAVDITSSILHILSGED